MKFDNIIAALPAVLFTLGNLTKRASGYLCQNRREFCKIYLRFLYQVGLPVFTCIRSEPLFGVGSGWHYIFSLRVGFGSDWQLNFFSANWAWIGLNFNFSSSDRFRVGFLHLRLIQFSKNTKIFFQVKNLYVRSP